MVFCLFVYIWHYFRKNRNVNVTASLWRLQTKSFNEGKHFYSLIVPNICVRNCLGIFLSVCPSVILIFPILLDGFCLNSMLWALNEASYSSLFIAIHFPVHNPRYFARIQLGLNTSCWKSVINSVYIYNWSFRSFQIIFIQRNTELFKVVCNAITSASLHFYCNKIM